MYKLLHDLFYAVDDKGVSSLDESRVALALALVSYISTVASAVLWKGQTLDIQGFGFGLAALVFGGGHGIKAYNSSPS